MTDTSMNDKPTYTVLPFTTSSGQFNGDMFEDWYRHKPKKEDERLWVFMHNWEDQMRERVQKELIEEFMEWSRANYERQR